MLTFFQQRRRARQADAIGAMKGARNSIKGWVTECLDVGALRFTGDTEGQSPVLEYVDPEEHAEEVAE